MRWARAVFAVCVLYGWAEGAPQAMAQCECARCRGGFLESIAQDYAQRNRWPFPYVCPDREAVRAPFAIMVHNGWRRQNLLCDEHFKEGTAELTDAGRLKIQRIMTEVPAPHRTIYVRRADSPEKTAARIQAVQELATRLAPEGTLAVVQETTVAPAGWSAERLDTINRKFHAAVPVPQLPPPQSSQSGGNQTQK